MRAFNLYSTTKYQKKNYLISVNYNVFLQNNVYYTDKYHYNTVNSLQLFNTNLNTISNPLTTLLVKYYLVFLKSIGLKSRQRNLSFSLQMTNTVKNFNLKMINSFQDFLLIYTKSVTLLWNLNLLPRKSIKMVRLYKTVFINTLNKSKLPKYFFNTKQYFLYKQKHKRFFFFNKQKQRKQKKNNLYFNRLSFLFKS